MHGIRIVILSAILIFFGATGLGATAPKPVAFLSLTLHRPTAPNLELLLPNTRSNRKLVGLLEKRQNNQKFTAIALAIALGPFGVHRLYLGTKPVVPVVYTLTLGGGLGVLPLADIIAILIAEDLSSFKNNDKVIMWAN